MLKAKKWQIFRQTIVATIILLIIKYLLDRFGLEVLSISAFHTSILAGTIFVLGFFLSSTHTDYKESEKIPSDLSTAIESLYQDGVMFHHKHPQFDLAAYTAQLLKILVAFKQDIPNHTYESLNAAKNLSKFFLVMEELGTPPNYIVKLKQEQSTILRMIFRMHYLLKIQPLPSAFLLVRLIVLSIIIMILLTDIPGVADELAITGFFSFLYIYVLRLIKIMDMPFHAEGSTMDDVSLFLLKEQQERLQATLA